MIITTWATVEKQVVNSYIGIISIGYNSFEYQLEKKYINVQVLKKYKENNKNTNLFN